VQCHKIFYNFQINPIIVRTVILQQLVTFLASKVQVLLAGRGPAQTVDSPVEISKGPEVKLMPA